MTVITDDKRIGDLMRLVEVGNYVDAACCAVGISTGTFYTWLKVGRQVEERVAAESNDEELRVALLRGEQVLDLTAHECRCWVVRSLFMLASSRAEIEAMTMVRKQMPEQWTAAMTFLERRFPDRWRRRKGVDVDSAPETEVAGIDEAQIIADPQASHLIHEALKHVSSEVRQELRRPLKSR